MESTALGRLMGCDVGAGKQVVPSRPVEPADFDEPLV